MSAVADSPVRPRLNRWVESITDAWLCATLAWEAEREAVAVGYATEMEEFEREHPRPRLRDFMIQMSHNA